jgi:hypothetical protein
MAAVGATALLLAVPAARADGDPASDVLPAADVFSYAPKQALVNLVASVNAGGNRVKVALIASRYDLGSVPSLFGKPALYAKFLGLELRTVYSGVLVVVMPAGVGVWNGGRPIAPEEQALAGLPKAPLAAVAEQAVKRLAAARLLHYTDVLPPLVYALPGGQYAVSDDSGRAAVTISLYAGKKPVGTTSRPLAAVNPAAVYRVKRVARATRFCITAVDASGNPSKPACAHM